MGDGTIGDNKEKANLLIPEFLKEVYVTGVAIASTPYNIRLILFNEEIAKDGDILNSFDIDLLRTAKAEIIMHPAVAKQIADLIYKELDNYEKKINKLNSNHDDL